MNRIPLPREYVVCDWCRSDDYRSVTGCLFDEEGRDSLPNAFKHETFSYVKCNKCGLVYLPYRPNRDDIPLYYSNDYCCFHDYSDRGIIMNSLAKLSAYLKYKQIARYMPSDCKVLLDYGCGSGTWIRLLNRFNPGWRIIGTDIAEEPIEGLRKKGVEAYVCDENNVFNFLDPESVGIIHLFHVIEHVPTPLNLLKVLFKLLKPGGFIVGQTPNVDSLERRILADYWNQWHAPRHFVIFNKHTLKRHAEEAGFKVISQKTSLSAATQWSCSIVKWRALKAKRSFTGIKERIYPPLIIPFIPVTLIQLLLRVEASHQDFILQKSSISR